MAPSLSRADRRAARLGLATHCTLLSRRRVCTGGCSPVGPQAHRPVRLQERGLEARYREVMPEVTCFGCGAVVPDVDGPVHAYMLAAPGCWALYSSVLGWGYADAEARSPGIAQALVDSYAAQHATNTERRNRQSVALHLMSLCAAFDHQVPAESRQRLIGRLAHRDYPALVPVPGVFTVTIRYVGDATGHDRPAAVRHWARATWDAWSAHHQRLRSWLSDELPERR